MIVYRVAQGTAWSRNTFNEVAGSRGPVTSSVQFNHEVIESMEEGAGVLVEVLAEKMDGQQAERVSFAVEKGDKGSGVVYQDTESR